MLGLLVTEALMDSVLWVLFVSGHGVITDRLSEPSGQKLFSPSFQQLTRVS